MSSLKVEKNIIIKARQMGITKSIYYKQLSLDNLIKSVSNSFPIYQLLGKMNKSIGWLPDEVLTKVCESYLKNSHKITKPWPWFVKAVNESWRAWNAEENIKENERMKREPIPSKLLDLVNTITKYKETL